MTQHHFDVEVAQEYGINCAILINNFQFWIAKNKAGGRNLNDGRTWTYNSNRALATLFPYFTEKQIRDTLLKLETAGVLVSGNFNKSTYDRTKWYAFNDEEQWLKGYGQLHPTKKSNGPDQKVEPIPDSKQHIETTDKDNTAKYAFEGRTIRLTHADYNKWVEAFPLIDIRCELTGLDAYYDSLSVKERGNVFVRVSQALAKRNRGASAENRAVQKEAESYKEFI